MVVEISDPALTYERYTGRPGKNKSSTTNRAVPTKTHQKKPSGRLRN